MLIIDNYDISKTMITWFCEVNFQQKKEHEKIIKLIDCGGFDSRHRIFL